MEMIHTTRGDLPVSSLIKSIDVQDYADATITATEYRIDGEIVRRDVDVALKPKALLTVEQQGF